MTTPGEGGSMTIQTGKHREQDPLQLNTLSLTDLDVEEQGEQVRGGEPCSTGQHYPNANVPVR